MLHIIDYKYLPDPLEVSPGLTVVVMGFPDTNKTAAETEPHTVTDVRCPISGPCDTFDVRNVPPDMSEHPFKAPTEPGTYPYFCRYHGDRQGSGMVGTLVVSESVPVATPPTSTNAAPTSPEGNETSFAGFALVLTAVLLALGFRRR